VSILLLTRPQPAGPIAAHLARLAPDLAVAEDAEAVDPAAVRCVVAYRLAPGVLSRFPRLQLLCAASSGVDKLLALPDLPAGLPVVRVADTLQAAQIAQYVCGHAIAHVRDFAAYREQQRSAQWLRHAPPAFGSVPATVLGLGHTGRAVARMLAAVGFDVAGWSRTSPGLEGIAPLPDREALAERLTHTRVLVCTLPLTAHTEGLIDAAMLAALPPGALLINVGRGEVVDDGALADALRAGRLQAVLDVHRQEPLPPEAAVWQLPGLSVTPHVASQPSPLAVAQTVALAWQRLQSGQPHDNLVDRVRGY
jgi:phosphoglycerate dehydrogenase-like enzyme